MTTRKDIAPLQYRSFTVDRSAINTQARTIEVALSSELPYERWWGTEILSHDAAHVQLGRLSGGRHPWLVEHSTKDQVGVIEKAWVDVSKVLRCLVRFGKSARAEEIWQDIQDGIRTLVSVGYQIHGMRLLSVKDEVETYLVDSWEPFEGSTVAVPADPSVGVGRDAELAHIRSLISTAKKGLAMTTATEKPAEQPAATPAAAVPAQPKAADSRDLLAQERHRVKEITALGERFKCQAEAAAAADSDITYDAFREKVFTNLEKSGALKVAEPGQIGLTEKEIASFSFAKLLLAAANPTEARLQSAAAFEIAASRAAQDKRDNMPKEREGCITIPFDVLSRGMAINDASAIAATQLLRQFQLNGGGGRMGRDLVAGTPTAGGNLVATELLGSSFIDILVNEMVIMKLGTTMLTGLQGNIAIPRATAGSTGYWVAENTSSTESQPAFDQVALTPKTCGAYVDYGRRLLLQSSVSVEAFLRMDIARTIALMIDLAAIAGSGASNQPRGVLNTSGIGSIAGGTNGADPTWDHIVGLETLVDNANAPANSQAYLTNTRVRGKLKRTQVFTGTNGERIWKGGELNDHPAWVSNQVPSNLTKGSASGVCSAILYGNWRDLLIGLWGGLDILFDPYTGATAGTKRLVALQDVDVNVRYPVSFAAMTDALTV